VPLHCLGNHVAARVSIERSLGGGTISANPRAGIRYRFDQPMAARVILPQMLWLQGFPDQAMDAARNSLEEARATGHAISVCDALAQAAIPIAMFTGDIKTVEGSITSLLDHSGSNGLGPWRVLARCWRGSYAVKHGNLADGIAELKTGLDALREVRFAFYHTQFMATLAEGLAASGQLQEANALIDQAVVRCRDKEELWCVAELLRIQGEIKLQETSPHLERAEQALLQALETARQQGALSLELRAAASLARYRCSRGCEEEARTSLVEVYNRFTEGFGTRDLIGAKALIDELACGY
jgi:predicted ATPase